MNGRRILAWLATPALVVALTSTGGVRPSPATAADTAPINVGLIYSKTGLLASYGAQYADGFQAGLDYATHGTGVANGHKIIVTERDDAGDFAKARAAAKELIGSGYKIIAGSTSSGVALQMAPQRKRTKCFSSPAPQRPTGLPATITSRSAPGVKRIRTWRPLRPPSAR